MNMKLALESLGIPLSPFMILMLVFGPMFVLLAGYLIVVWLERYRR